MSEIRQVFSLRQLFFFFLFWLELLSFRKIVPLTWIFSPPIPDDESGTHRLCTTNKVQEKSLKAQLYLDCFFYLIGLICNTSVVLFRLLKTFFNGYL